MIKIWTIITVLCLGLVIGLNVEYYYIRKEIFNGNHMLSRSNGFYHIFPISEKNYWKLRALFEKGGYTCQVSWNKTRGDK